jgi:UDP-N-acetylmuramyl pentapeptide phosphotransferase/UDP-N-acetylglucosamine-1-phosphate transferase
MNTGWVAFGATLFAGFALAALARTSGWVDRSLGEEFRKPRTSRIPLVGGVALASGIGVSLTLGPLDLPWAALVAALIVGLFDDVRGLRPRAKLIGQSVVGLILAIEWGSPMDDPLGATAWLLGAVVAQNVVNTWDHADGTCIGLATLALWPVVPLRGALLAVAALNLPTRRDPRARSPRVPWLYVGDAGSHALGILLLVHPSAWPFLVLPALDLCRVAWLRHREGGPFWLGDRRHLAHRFEALGWSSPWAALGSLAPVLPALTLVQEPLTASWVTGVLWVVAVLGTRDPGPTGVKGPGGDPTETGAMPCAAPGPAR